MSVPYTVSVAYDGLVTKAGSSAGSADSASTLCLRLTGAGTKVIDFGTVANAKLIAVHVPREGNTASIQVRLDGAATGLEVSPGGFIVVSSPNPIAGINSAAIDYTVDSLVYCDILG